MTYLLDTNVVSEARKGGRADADVRRWFTSVSAGDLYISVLVVGEIRQGIERLRRDPTQTEVVEAWLATLRRRYADRIVPITAEVAEEWGRMNAADPIPAIDGLMVATAKINGMTFVTRNTRHVERAGVAVLDPFHATA